MRIYPARVNDVGDQDSAPAGATAVRASEAKRPFEREPETVAGWDTRYTAQYVSRSQANLRKRLKSRLHNRGRLERAGSGSDDDEDEDNALRVEIRRGRFLSRNALVALRWEIGFRWDGGLFAGSDTYRCDPFCFRGLVSDQHPILQLFVTKVRRAKNLMVGDHKGAVYGVDSKLLALDMPYVEDNKAVCGVLRVEVDALLSWEAIADHCRAAGVPLPNVAVGWVDAQHRVHNPHLVWLLHDSVPLQGRKCARFAGLYRRVLRGLTNALLPMGADPGGLLNSHRHKNPLCPLWDRRVFAEKPYDLSTLAGHVDTTVRMEALKRMAAARPSAATPAPDHPNPKVAAGSNRLFAHLAEWARREVAPHRAAGGGESEFAVRVADEAHRFASALTGDSRRSERAARATAASVSKWTWNVYRASAPKRTEVSKRAKLSETKLAARRAAGGREAARRQKARSEKAIVGAAVRHFRRHKRAPTQAVVLEAVRRCGLKSERTVRRHWPAVRAALAALERKVAKRADRTSALVVVKKVPQKTASVGRRSPPHPVPVTPTMVVAVPRHLFGVTRPRSGTPRPASEVASVPSAPALVDPDPPPVPTELVRRSPSAGIGTAAAPKPVESELGMKPPIPCEPAVRQVDSTPTYPSRTCLDFEPYIRRLAAGPCPEQLSTIADVFEVTVADIEALLAMPLSLNVAA